ncbi:MAG TPA: hypothetical protein DCM14_00505 [Clostridiales bacterium UBA8153]|nr:hypothetical protein [Clostridiales bacterium UBA8153]
MISARPGAGRLIGEDVLDDGPITGMLYHASTLLKGHAGFSTSMMGVCVMIAAYAGLLQAWNKALACRVESRRNRGH